MRKQRLDPSSIAGVTIAAAAIVGGQWLEGGAIRTLFQFTAFCIVIGGTFGAVMLQSPLSTFIDGIGLARWVFRRPAGDDAEAVAALVDWARIARGSGFLALEDRLDDVPDPFTRKGLRMLIDGFDADRMRNALDLDINAWEDRHLAAARVWEAAGGYAPTIGIIGAVLGLIHVMENLTDPTLLGGGIAVAFVATIYGVAFANLVFLPVAAKLRALVAAEVAYRDLLLDGLTGIATGENPRVIEARLFARAA